MDLGWLNIVEILLLLAACWACYNWGKVNGIGVCIEALLEKNIITERDLDRLND